MEYDATHMVLRDASHVRSSLVSNRIYVPGLIREVMDTFGEAAACRLVQQFGGQRITIPLSVPPDSRLAKVLGSHLARWFVMRHGGNHVDIPLAARLRIAMRDSQAAKLRQQGKSAAAIARELAVAERTVYRMIVRVRERSLGGGGIDPAPQPSRRAASSAGKARSV